MSHTGKIFQVRKDEFAPDIVVSDPQTGKPVRVPGRLIEAGTEYIVLSVDGGNGGVIADLKDVQIPRDEQVIGLPVKYDIVGDYAKGDRVHAVNVVAA